MRYGIRQKDLAEMLGYEQSYISALEIGTKGPPTEALVSKLGDELNLGEGERAALRTAVQESQRKYVLPNDAPDDVFRMCSELWAGLENLHPAQVQMIREVIHLKDQLMTFRRPEQGRVYRRQKEVAEM